MFFTITSVAGRIKSTANSSFQMQPLQMQPLQLQYQLYSNYKVLRHWNSFCKIEDEQTLLVPVWASDGDVDMVVDDGIKILLTIAALSIGNGVKDRNRYIEYIDTQWWSCDANVWAGYL